MASLNKVFIMGHLGQDPELRYTANQNPVVTLNVATKDSWTGRDGQRQETTEWHRVIVWGKQAENCSKYLSKGRAVFVEGRLQTRAWDDKQGQKRYTTEINASSVQFMPSSAASGSAGLPADGASFEAASPSGHTHFPQADAPTSASQGLPSLDDIPF